THRPNDAQQVSWGFCLAISNRQARYTTRWQTHRRGEVRSARQIIRARLRTRGSWVRILPGAPLFNDLAAKTKSSFLLWDRCGTSYPPVRADLTEFKHFASETKSFFLVVGPYGTFSFNRSALAIGDAQYRPRAAPLDEQIRLFQ